jgi:hypothetical protein
VPEAGFDVLKPYSPVSALSALRLRQSNTTHTGHVDRRGGTLVPMSPRSQRQGCASPRGSAIRRTTAARVGFTIAQHSFAYCKLLTFGQ